MATERFTVASKDGSLSWGAVLPKLAEHFTVYAMDRRGRAPSGDAQEYSIAKEADDIAAVVEAIGGPVIILAHSYGALATLEALYEPPVALKPGDPAIVANLDRALEANDREELVTTFLRDQIRVPPDRIPVRKSSPIWPIVLQISPTLPRETRTVNAYHATTVFVRDAIPGCRMVILEDQGHGAMLDAPDFFAAKVLELAAGVVPTPSRS